VFLVLLANPKEFSSCMTSTAIHNKKTPLTILRASFRDKDVLKP
jgi:hypothetical protein